MQVFGYVNDEEIQAMAICPRHRKDLTNNWSGQKG